MLEQWDELTVSATEGRVLLLSFITNRVVTAVLLLRYIPLATMPNDSNAFVGACGRGTGGSVDGIGVDAFRPPSNISTVGDRGIVSVGRALIILDNACASCSSKTYTLKKENAVMFCL